MIFAKKSKFHDAGGPDTAVSPSVLNVKVIVVAFNQEKALLVTLLLWTWIETLTRVKLRFVIFRKYVNRWG